jgi:hypothetical protein
VNKKTEPSKEFALISLVLIVILAVLAVNDARTEDAATRGISAISLGNTYYVALDGSDSNPGTMDLPWRTLQYAANTVAAGDTIYIRAGTYNEPVRFYYKPNTTGQYTTLMAYPGEEVILDGTGVPVPPDNNWAYEGLVYIARSSYVRISGIRVQNVDMAGVYIGYADHILIDHVTTYNTVKSGISNWGASDIIIEYNDVSMACVDHPGHVSSEEPITTASGNNIEVRYNVVHDGPTGQNPGRAGGEGINTKESSHNVYVHHNLVYNIWDKVGLSVDAWGGDLSDVYIYDNISRNNMVGLLVSDERNILPGTQDVHVFNNLIYNNTRFGIYVPNYMENGPLVNAHIVNNVIYGTHNADGNGYGIYVLSDNATDMLFQNNIVANNDIQIYVSPGAAPDYTFTHNLYFGPGDPYGNDYVVGDPLFVDPVNYNFRVISGSPAIDAGLDTDAPSDDYDGITRPQGSGYDIGAFEASGFIPTSTTQPPATATSTPVPTITNTPTSTPSPTTSATSTRTPTPTRTPTRTATPTRTPRYTATPTRTPEPTLECVWVRFSDGVSVLVCR